MLYFLMVFEQLAQGTLVSDGSFLSKFTVINSAIYYVNNHFTIYDYLFGIGLARSYELINIGAHNIGVILFFETGVIGSLVYFLYLSTLLSKTYISNRAVHYYILFIGVFLFIGFSLGLYLFPIMVLTFAFLAKFKEIKG